MGLSRGSNNLTRLLIWRHLDHLSGSLVQSASTQDRQKSSWSFRRRKQRRKPGTLTEKPPWWNTSVVDEKKEEKATVWCSELSKVSSPSGWIFSSGLEPLLYFHFFLFIYFLSWSLLDYFQLLRELKELDLVDRVPEELWTEVCTTVREVVNWNHPQERNARRQSGCLRGLYK